MSIWWPISGVRLVPVCACMPQLSDLGIEVHLWTWSKHIKLCNGLTVCQVTQPTHCATKEWPITNKMMCSVSQSLCQTVVDHGHINLFWAPKIIRLWTMTGASPSRNVAFSPALPAGEASCSPIPSKEVMKDACILIHVTVWCSLEAAQETWFIPCHSQMPTRSCTRDLIHSMPQSDASY